MITEEQKTKRRESIGSSDASAIMGLDPYRSAADIWLEKTGKLKDVDDSTEQTDRGNYLEPALVAFAEHQLGPLTRAVTAACHEFPALTCNCDALLVETNSPIEAKSTVLSEEWGEDGTDEVPPRVVIQTHEQMLCLGSDSAVAWVPVILPGFRSFDLRMYKVKRDEELVQMIGMTCQSFWDNHVVKDIPPTDFRPSIEIIKRVRRLPNKIVPIEPALVVAYQAAHEQEKVAKAKKEQAQVAILAALQDAEAGDYLGGQVTYFEQSRKAYEVQATKFRVLRIKESK